MDKVLPDYKELEITCLNSDLETCFLGAGSWLLLTVTLGISLFIGAGLSALAIKLIRNKSKYLTPFMIANTAGILILPLLAYMTSQLFFGIVPNALIGLSVEILVLIGLITMPSLILTYVVLNRVSVKNRSWSMAILMKRVSIIYLGLGSLVVVLSLIVFVTL